jgi:GMC oxidoreductase
LISRSVRALVVEGNYLLLDQHPWSGLHAIFDITVAIDAPEDILRQRLVERWRGYGFSPTEIGAKVEPNYLPNGRYIMSKSTLVFNNAVGEPLLLRVPAHFPEASTAIEGLSESARRTCPSASVGGVVSGPDCQSDEALDTHMRRIVGTAHHPTSSCAMGSGPAAVVDPQLRVYGAEGLRVADASIMPVIIRGHPNAPTVMIGEKASDTILGAPAHRRPMTSAA